MSRFALRFPYFIVVLCLMVTRDRHLERRADAGRSSSRRSAFPVVVVATFYNGMPPEQIENDITGRFERFFTLGSGIEHIESRSLTGVSLIKVYFQPGTNADSAVTTISNLAMADLGRLPPGTLPPVVLKSDASSLPVCLVTLERSGPDRDAIARSTASSPSATRSPACRARRYRSRSAASTGRSWSTSTPRSSRPTSSASWTWCARSTPRTSSCPPARSISVPTDYNIYTNSQLKTRSTRSTTCRSRWSATSPVLVKDVGRRAGLLANPVQHCPRRRAEVGLPAHPQAGRRFQHHRHRRRREESHLAVARRAEIARHQRCLRSVDLRQEGDRESHPRGRDRPRPYGDHDPRSSSAISARPMAVFLSIPAFGAGHLRRPFLRR